MSVLVLRICCLLLLAWARPSLAGTSYDNCTGFITSVPTTINGPGTWCLNQNLSTAIASGHAIEVASDDVTIDCNDFGIDGSAAGPTSATLGIHALNHNHLTVRHCTIRGFYRGVHSEGTGSRQLVEDNHLDRNLRTGIRIDGSDSIVRHNLVSNTGGTTIAAAAYTVYGILVEGNDDIIGNTISGVFAAAGTNGSVRAISTQSDVGGSIAENKAGSLTADGTGTAGGILVTSPSRMAIHDNELAGDGKKGNGVECDGANKSYPVVRVLNNVITGFNSHAIIGCGNGGGNDTGP